MCGRYASTRDPATLAVEFDALDGTAGADEGAPGGGYPGADYNVAPTKPVLSVVTRHPRDAPGSPDPDRTVRSIRVMRWGLVPHWAKDPGVGSRMINARAETATGKPAFRDAVARRRCLLPADGWYEWQPSATPGMGKRPFFITPADGSGLALAGLWATWRGADAEAGAPPLVTCAVLTTEAVGPLAEIHDRMPLVLPAEAWQDWLNPDSEDPSRWLAAPSAALVRTLELRPVSTAVGDVRRQGPELVERIEPEQPMLLDLGRVR
ncbi:MAG: SOS response-associated peptidase [Pseudonocardiaceae bacterium]